jgi:hypothetical protein
MGNNTTVMVDKETRERLGKLSKGKHMGVYLRDLLSDLADGKPVGPVDPASPAMLLKQVRELRADIHTLEHGLGVVAQNTANLLGLSKAQREYDMEISEAGIRVAIKMDLLIGWFDAHFPGFRAEMEKQVEKTIPVVKEATKREVENER